MKKNQKNSTGIMLVAVQTEKNQKQKLYVQLINNLLCFNTKGLEKISDYMNDLLQIDAYISKDSHSNE